MRKVKINSDKSNKAENLSSESVKGQKAERKRKFPRFGIIDATIVILVVAIAVGIYFRYSFFDTLNNMKNQKECYVTFKTENITTDISKELNEGDGVYFKSNGNEFGNLAVKSEEISMVIQEQPAVNTVYKDGIAYADVQYPQEVNKPLIYGTGTIKCNCTISEDGSYLLNGTTYIAVGQSYTVCTERVTFTITITEIEAIS